MKNKQKESIEKITGKSVDGLNLVAIKLFFEYTNKGKRNDIPPEAADDFNYLLFCHKQHPISVEYWKKDFKSGLLFLEDFVYDGVPLSYFEHVVEIYSSVFGYTSTHANILLKIVRSKNNGKQIFQK